ncbi:MAG: glycoside hydrolase family 30 beta sandwich domain-containing protein [Candidatus Saccharimonadales bacterium]
MSRFSHRLQRAAQHSQVPASETVQWWRTNAGASQLYAPQTGLSWQPYDGNPGTRPITVDSSQQYQAMLGFGAAVTDAATSVIWSMPTVERAALMDDMFGGSGLKLDVVRLPMGSSDFARSAYTYDDSVSPDPTLADFSVAMDETYTIPLLQAALQRNPNLKIFAVPWSAPAWMKTNGSLNAGSLKPEYYGAYAQYFVKFIQAYQAHGLGIYAVSPQNEPLHTTGSYPSMSMSAAQQAVFIGQHLGPAFAAASITTRIITYDHNWDNTSYASNVFDDPQAGGYTSGSAWHAYAGEVTAQTTVHNAYPGKDIYFTEITASQPDNFGPDLQWFMRNIGIGAPYNWARTSIYWNLALDENNGPLNGGYTTGQGVVRVASSNAAVTRYSTYYGLKHLSHKLVPGAVRIGCTNHGTGYVLATAYQNPGGSTICHLLCDAQSAQTFKLIADNKSVTLTLQPGDVVTCTW